MSRGASAQRVARTGEHFVAAELNRRGAYAVTFAGNMPNIDILASDEAQTRTVMLQVKTRRRGTWHSSTTRGEPRTEDDADGKFWSSSISRMHPLSRRTTLRPNGGSSTTSMSTTSPTSPRVLASGHPRTMHQADTDRGVEGPVGPARSLLTR